MWAAKRARYRKEIPPRGYSQYCRLPLKRVESKDSSNVYRVKGTTLLLDDVKNAGHISRDVASAAFFIVARPGQARRIWPIFESFVAKKLPSFYSASLVLQQMMKSQGAATAPEYVGHWDFIEKLLDEGRRATSATSNATAIDTVCFDALARKIYPSPPSAAWRPLFLSAAAHVLGCPRLTIVPGSIIVETRASANTRRLANADDFERFLRAHPISLGREILVIDAAKTSTAEMVCMTMAAGYVVATHGAFVEAAASFMSRGCVLVEYVHTSRAAHFGSSAVSYVHWMAKHLSIGVREVRYPLDDAAASFFDSVRQIGEHNERALKPGKPAKFESMTSSPYWRAHEAKISDRVNFTWDEARDWAPLIPDGVGLSAFPAFRHLVT
ncbi:unnamed protein product [Amoebophrya sp. A25]|nr:unnamed protein product [Amoebophrya sp. A25]|eukprot:GSA25T00023425001.1